LTADCGLSLRPQTKLGNLKKADAQGYDPGFYDVRTQLRSATSPY
jgi:hypothetical protein